MEPEKTDFVTRPELYQWQPDGTAEIRPFGGKEPRTLPLHSRWNPLENRAEVAVGMGLLFTGASRAAARQEALSFLGERWVVA